MRTSTFKCCRSDHCTLKLHFINTSRGRPDRSWASVCVCRRTCEELNSLWLHVLEGAFHQRAFVFVFLKMRCVGVCSVSDNVIYWHGIIVKGVSHQQLWAPVNTDTNKRYVPLKNNAHCLLLYHVWSLHHTNPVYVAVPPCGQMQEHHRRIWTIEQKSHFIYFYYDIL